MSETSCHCLFFWPTFIPCPSLFRGLSLQSLLSFPLLSPILRSHSPITHTLLSFAYTLLSLTHTRSLARTLSRTQYTNTNSVDLREVWQRGNAICFMVFISRQLSVVTSLHINSWHIYLSKTVFIQIENFSVSVCHNPTVACSPLFFFFKFSANQPLVAFWAQLCSSIPALISSYC